MITAIWLAVAFNAGAWAGFAATVYLLSLPAAPETEGEAAVRYAERWIHETRKVRRC